MEVPKSLRLWFFAHFIIDYSIAIPIFLFPVEILESLGWPSVDLVATRVVAAALFGIGNASLLSAKSSISVYKHMLQLKIIWSLTATTGILITASGEPMPTLGWIALASFALFGLIWIYYYIRIIKFSPHD